MTREKDKAYHSRRSTNGNVKHKAKKQKKWTWKKTFWLLFFMTAFAVFCAIGGYLFVLLNGERLVNEYKDADRFKLAEMSTIYDVNGTEIEKLGVNRETVESREISDLMRKAFIAIEDRRFDDHDGVDLWSIGRAMVKDIMAGDFVEGGSTITQQLVKNKFLQSEKTLFRKATEVSVALALENHCTKDEIFTMYLNEIFFGQNAYGIKAAAKVYFNKENLDDLKLWEIATLAAIPKAPSKYNPLSSPELSKERRAVVLQRMVEEGYITAAEERDAAAIDYDPKNSGHVAKSGNKQNEAYYTFIDYVMKEAVKRTGLTEGELNRGGYRIYTTMDANVQQVMYDVFNDDSLFESSKDHTQVQGAMVITDHSNGSIVAMMGGRDYVRTGLNRVTDQPRQPGSSIKPLIAYAPALETGKYTPWSQLNNQKQCFGRYCPTNLGGYSTSVEMTEAIKRSINMPTVWLLNEIGLKTGIDFATNLGIPFTKKDFNLSSALGGLTYGATPLNMAEAYSAFANGGNYYPSYTILKITDRKNKDYYTYHVPRGKRVMSEQTAYYMTEMMQEAVQSGTGRSARISGRSVAGKTGTSQHGIPNYRSLKGDRDVWFVGYTPEWTAAVWMGYDKTDRNHLLYKDGRAAAMFSKVMGQALQSKKSTSFKKPDYIERRPEKLKAVQGLRATYSENLKSVTLEWNRVSGDNITYHVYRKSSKDEKFSRILPSVKGTRAEDISVLVGETYTYYVTAVKDERESNRSGEVSLSIQEEQQITPPMVSPADPPVVDPPLTDESNPQSEGSPSESLEPTDSINGSDDEEF